eukprot:PhM_4_TR10167/c1_g1_i1/m.55496
MSTSSSQQQQQQPPIAKRSIPEIEDAIDDLTLLADKNQYAADKCILDRNNLSLTLRTAQLDVITGFLCTSIAGYAARQYWPHTNANSSVLYKIPGFPFMPVPIARLTNGWGIVMTGVILASFNSFCAGSYVCYRDWDLVDYLDQKEREHRLLSEDLNKKKADMVSYLEERKKLGK